MPHSLAHWWVDSFVLSLRAGHRANAPVNPLLDGPVTGSWLSGPDCRASGSWPAGPPARLVTGRRLAFRKGARDLGTILTVVSCGGLPVETFRTAGTFY